MRTATKSSAAISDSTASRQRMPRGSPPGGSSTTIAATSRESRTTTPGCDRGREVRLRHRHVRLRRHRRRTPPPCLRRAGPAGVRVQQHLRRPQAVRRQRQQHSRVVFRSGWQAIDDRMGRGHPAAVDERNNIVELRFLGVDGKPRERPDSGCAAQTWTRDERGNMSEIACLGADLKPRMRLEGGPSRH